MDNNKKDLIYGLISEASNLEAQERYFDAFKKWDEAVTELDVTLQQTKTLRLLSKGAGFAGALMTGGLGLEDVFLVPMITKGLMKILKIDLDEFMEQLEKCIHSRQKCMDYEDDIILISDFHREISYYCYCYEISNEVDSSSDKLSKLLKLVNPFEDNNSLKLKKPISELYQEILKIIYESKNINRFKIDRLNKSLLNYLSKHGKRNNDLYNGLISLK